MQFSMLLLFIILLSAMTRMPPPIACLPVRTHHGKRMIFMSLGLPFTSYKNSFKMGDSYPKWKVRSWQGVYVGHSTCHASNVPLIYNYQTTHVSPQYHLIFDEDFTSITDPGNAKSEELMKSLYESTSWIHSSNFPDFNDEYYFDSFWMDPPLAPKPENRGRKQKNQPLRGSIVTKKRGR
jgi:hypothetical protein